MSERSYEGLVTLNQPSQKGMITLRGDFDDLSKAVSLPAPGTCGADGEKAVAWMSPDELLVLLPHAEVRAEIARITAALNGTHHLAADVSDARVLFDIKGDALRDVLAKLCPVDMRPSSTTIGRFRRTRLAQVPCAFWLRAEDHAELIVFTSVADYAWN
ncbi:MAG: sarcosine oxidase subunit gamma family protein, partial [Pseudomonadota bacterium]